MSIRSGFTLLVLFGIISVVIPITAVKTPDRSKEISTNIGKHPLNSMRNGVVTDTPANKKNKKETKDAFLSEGEGRDRPSLLTRSTGDVDFLGLRFRGDNFGNGVTGSLSHTSIGNYLSMNQGGVHLQVVSPHSPQKVAIKKGKVFVNNRVVCNNIRELCAKLTYQRGKDGSLWYSNLKVGQAMTPDEMKAFKIETEAMEAEVPSTGKEGDEESESGIDTDEHVSGEFRNKRGAALDDAKKLKKVALEEADRLKEQKQALEEAVREAKYLREAAVAEANTQIEKAKKLRVKAQDEIKSMKEKVLEEAKKRREKELEEATKQREEIKKLREEALKEAKKQIKEANKLREKVLEEKNKLKEEEVKEETRQKENPKGKRMSEQAAMRARRRFQPYGDLEV